MVVEGRVSPFTEACIISEWVNSSCGGGEGRERGGRGEGEGRERGGRGEGEGRERGGRGEGEGRERGGRGEGEGRERGREGERGRRRRREGGGKEEKKGGYTALSFPHSWSANDNTLAVTPAHPLAFHSLFLLFLLLFSSVLDFFEEGKATRNRDRVIKRRRKREGVPEPQVVMRGLLRSTPLLSNTFFNSSSGNNV